MSLYNYAFSLRLTKKYLSFQQSKLSFHTLFLTTQLYPGLSKKKILWTTQTTSHFQLFCFLNVFSSNTSRFASNSDPLPQTKLSSLDSINSKIWVKDQSSTAYSQTRNLPENYSNLSTRYEFDLSISHLTENGLWLKQEKSWTRVK